MIPQPGQHVKCFLQSGNVLEGIVQNWAETGVVLKSLDGESLLIIHHPAHDIRITKIVLTQALSPKIMPPSTELKQEFEQAVSAENDVDLRTKSLVELHQLKTAQERKILVSKLREHHLGETRQVKYEQPRFRTQRGTQ